LDVKHQSLGVQLTLITTLNPQSMRRTNADEFDACHIKNSFTGFQVQVFSMSTVFGARLTKDIHSDACYPLDIGNLEFTTPITIADDAPFPFDQVWWISTQLIANEKYFDISVEPTTTKGVVSVTVKPLSNVIPNDAEVRGTIFGVVRLVREYVK